MKATDKEITELYLQGNSASMVSLKVGVKLHGVYRALKREKIKRRSSSEQSQLRFESKAPTYEIASKLNQKQQKLLLAGIMLYYGEGAKTGNTVDFVNSDPKAHLVFMAFLREVCKVSENKLRLYLYCFSDQNLDSVIKFWSTLLKVPISQFTKPYVRTAGGKHAKRSPYGVLHLRYSDKKLLANILSLSDEIIQELV